MLVFQDKFSKWVEVYAIPDFTAETVAHKFVYEFCSPWGFPLELHSDQGRIYESKLFREACRILGVHKSRTSSWLPSAKGGVERFNKVLADMIACYVESEQKEWDFPLPLLTFAYRCCKPPATGMSPNLLMTGREATMPTELQVGSALPDPRVECYCDYVRKLRKKATVLHALAWKLLKAATQHQQRDHDARISENLYAVGDLVYYMNNTKTVGKSPKLDPIKWIDPCVVLKRRNDLLYVIKGGYRARRRSVHHDNLKPCLARDIPEWAQVLQRQLRPISGDQQRWRGNVGCLPDSKGTTSDNKTARSRTKDSTEADKPAPATQSAEPRPNRTNNHPTDCPVQEKNGKGPDGNRHSTRKRRQPDRYIP